MNSIESKNGIGTIDVSGDALREYAAKVGGALGYLQNLVHPSELEEMAQYNLESDLEDVLRVLEERGFSGLSNVRALVAHGESSTDGTFWYADGASNDKTAPHFPVQSWVNEHDGKYDVLLIYCCNPFGVRLSSKASILVYPDQGSFTREDIKTGSKLFLQSPNMQLYTQMFA